MAEFVNLNAVRKRKAREAKAEKAKANRARHGRAKAKMAEHEAEIDRAAEKLDGHRRERDDD